MLEKEIIRNSQASRPLRKQRERLGLGDPSGEGEFAAVPAGVPDQDSGVGLEPWPVAASAGRVEVEFGRVAVESSWAS